MLETISRDLILLNDRERRFPSSSGTVSLMSLPIGSQGLALSLGVASEVNRPIGDFKLAYRQAVAGQIWLHDVAACAGNDALEMLL